MNTGMSRMKLSGIGLLLVSIIGFFVYSYILFATVWDILILKFTVLIGLASNIGSIRLDRLYYCNCP